MFKIHTQYQDYIEAFPLAASRAGVLGPGRYSGFDSMVTRVGAGDIPLTIRHTLSLVNPTNEDNLPTGKQGTVVTPHGIVITTIDDVSVTLSANATSYQRIDVLYMQFSWVDTNPGNTPVVSVLQGIAGSGEPTLPSPNIQVKLGLFYLAAGATTIAGVTYSPAAVPLPGGANLLNNFPELDQRFAKLAYPNTFSAGQYWSMQTVDLGNGGVLLPDTANLFHIIGNGTALAIGKLLKNGTTLFNPGTLLMLTFSNIGNNSYLDPTGSLAGHAFRLGALPVRGVLTPSATQGFPIKNGDVVMLQYRGTVDGVPTWDILSPSTYIASTLYSHDAAIKALQNPPSLPWVDVKENGLSTYCFEAGFSSLGLQRFSYRKNSLGQLEFKGFFTTSINSNRSSIKICTIDPAYLTSTWPSIRFMCYFSTAGGAMKSIDAMIGIDGSVTMQEVVPGNYACTSVVSGV